MGRGANVLSGNMPSNFHEPILEAAESLCFSCLPNLSGGIMVDNLAAFCSKK